MQNLRTEIDCPSSERSIVSSGFAAGKRRTTFRATLAVAAFLTLSPFAQAQSANNATAAYNGWLQAFLIKKNGQTYFANTLTNRSMAFMWGQAYIITGVEDAFDVDQAPDKRQLVIDLLNTFETQNHADLSWDSWNDDIAWAAIALIRGYQISGQTSFLNAATQAWNMAYARGWDGSYGGGIWENMDNVPNGGKCALSNWPFVISGVQIYLATGDATFLTRAQQIYAFARANLFNTSTGLVHEQIGPSGVIGDDNYYNSGLLINAANELFKVTGNNQYYQDAVLAANHVISRYPITTEDHPANGDFGADQVFRGLGKFARENNLWSTYSSWFDNNAAAAWNHRRTDYNFSHNNFSTATSQSDLSTMEAEGSIVVQEAIQESAGVGDLSGTYQIQNVASGLAVTVYGDSRQNGTPLVQWQYNGQPGAKWTFVAAGGGYYHIENPNSGQVINVAAASGKSGAALLQWPMQGMAPGNDQWRPVRNADGTYTFINMLSGLALDLIGANPAAGTGLDQWFSNSTNAQKFRLIRE